MKSWLRRWWFRVWTARRAAVTVSLPTPASGLSMGLIARRPDGSWHIVTWGASEAEFLGHKPHWNRHLFATLNYQPAHSALQHALFRRTNDDDRHEAEWHSRPADRRCEVPPRGWFCTRDRGHDGPCAARRVAHR